MPHSKTRCGRDEWIQLMDAYEAGGLTQRQFCEHHGLAYSTFSYWRKRLSPAAATDAGIEPLIELPLLPITRPSAWRLELDLGQGVILRLK